MHRASSDTEPDDTGASAEYVGPEHRQFGGMPLGVPTFEQFHQARSGDAFRYATAIVGVDAAADACQDAWIRAWSHWGTFEPDRVDAWFLRIVRNCCVDLLRRRVPMPAGLLVDDPRRPVADAAGDDRADVSGALAILARLPAAHREILWLREVMDLTYGEIAGVLEIPIGTVMSRLHSARKKAAKLLDGSRS